MKHHFHDWDKWEDVGVVRTFMYTGGAIVQTKKCLICGIRKNRKTNTVTSSDVGAVGSILLKIFHSKS